jgi:peptidylprolyl isomerase
VAFPLLVVACGSTTPSTSKSTLSGSPTASGPKTTAGPSTPTGGAGTVPAVAQATNRMVEPVISAGSMPPPTSLQTVDLVVGTGAPATATSTVKINYVGADYATGKDFDRSTWMTRQAATFPLQGVVPGFSQGIVGMKVGGRREIVIPPRLGYGSTGSPPAVAPNETLVFVVDLMGLA